MLDPKVPSAHANLRKGIYLALIAAAISGLSVYVNKFAVTAVSDAVVFTTLKNTLVGLALVTFLVMTGSRRETKPENRKPLSLLALTVVALIGGSVPFLLFFEGLSLTSAANAALIQKSLFVWVALLAAPLLNERIGKWTVVGLVLLAVGQLLNGFPNAWTFGPGESLVLAATLLWGGETILVKHLLASTSTPTSIVATARMAGGAAVMWLYLLATGRADGVLRLSLAQWGWIALTGLILIAYVTTWYAALKLAPATVVTSALTMGAVITVGLSLVFEGQLVNASPLFGFLLMLVGVAIINGFWKVRSNDAQVATA